MTKSAVNASSPESDWGSRGRQERQGICGSTTISCFCSWSDTIWTLGSSITESSSLVQVQSVTSLWSNPLVSLWWERSQLHCSTSVQARPSKFSPSVMSDSFRPHGLQHARLSCPSPTPRACSNSYPLSWWCHPTISSSVVPFSSCLHSFPPSGFFPMNQFFTSGGLNIGASALESVLPMNIQD